MEENGPNLLGIDAQDRVVPKEVSPSLKEGEQIIGKGFVSVGLGGYG